METIKCNLFCDQYVGNDAKWGIIYTYLKSHGITVTDYQAVVAGSLSTWHDFELTMDQFKELYELVKGFVEANPVKKKSRDPFYRIEF